MGTHHKVINPVDLIVSIEEFSFKPNKIETEIKLNNLLKLLDIELRMQLIRITPNQQLDRKTSPRAAHVYVASKSFRKAFSYFKKKNIKFNKIGFPLGQEIYYMPNVMDSRIVTTKE